MTGTAKFVVPADEPLCRRVHVVDLLAGFASHREIGVAIIGRIVG
jgi:hypothetical protein